ncbi:MAG: hypothetical protein KBD50_03280 [Candidatus Pacebacteria bacterium]|nr:hypothetical protein [Candidatus Paceibacterota bacterium]
MQRKRRVRTLSSSHPQWKIITLSVLTGFASFTTGGVLASSGIISGTSNAAAVALATELGLEKDNNCDERKLVKFKSPGSGTTKEVYRLDGPWHDSNGCLLDILSAAEGQKADKAIYDFAYYQMLYLLSLPEVRFEGGDTKLNNVLDSNDELRHDKIKRVTWVGAKGEPYDAMGQSDLGGWAINMYRLTSKKDANKKQVEGYKTVAFGAMDTILTPVSDGGLLSRNDCKEKKSEKCSFFHSKTNENVEPSKAWTMNKHMYAANNLWVFGKDLENSGESTLKSKADKYKKAAVEGMHQLVYGESIKTGKTPTLFDYVPRNNGKAIQNSWIYYSIDTDTRNGYYLDAKGKNCNYHQLVVSLLVRNFKAMGNEVKMEGFTEKRSNLGNKSILEYLVRSYEIKKEDGLYKNTKTEDGGNFTECLDDNITKDDIKYLRSL